MIDIVNRLRFDATRCEATFSKGVAGNITEAADEIERLQRRVKALETYLQGTLDGPKDEWIAYADKLEAVLETVAGQSKDQLMKLHAEQGLRLVRPLPNGGRDSG